MAPCRWSRKIAAARTRRRLKTLTRMAESAAVGIGGDWGDVDQYLVDLADRLRDSFDEVAREIEEYLPHAEKEPDAEDAP